MGTTVRNASFTLSIFFSLILIPAQSALAADVPFQAKATAVTGKVTVTPLDAKAAIDVKVGQAFTQGDLIVTGPDSSLEIQYPDGGKTMVGADTQFLYRKMAKVGKKSTQVSMGLFTGKMRSTVAKLMGKESRFEYVTKSSICGVAGTDVSAEAGGEGEKFSIGKEGVAVVFPNDKTVKLTQGKLITPNQTMVGWNVTPDSGAGERLQFATQSPSFGGGPISLVGAVGMIESQAVLSRIVGQAGNDTPDIVNQAMTIAGKTGNTAAMTQVISGRSDQAASLAAIAVAANPANAAAIAQSVASAMPANATPAQMAAIAATIAASNPAAAAQIAAAVAAANPAAAATIAAAVTAVAPSAAAAITQNVASATNTTADALTQAVALVPAATVNSIASTANSTATAAVTTVNTISTQPINPAVISVAPALEATIQAAITQAAADQGITLNPDAPLADQIQQLDTVPTVTEIPSQTVSPTGTTPQ